MLWISNRKRKKQKNASRSKVKEDCACTGENTHHSKYPSRPVGLTLSTPRCSLLGKSVERKKLSVDRTHSKPVVPNLLDCGWRLGQPFACSAHAASSRSFRCGWVRVHYLGRLRQFCQRVRDSWVTCLLDAHAGVEVFVFHWGCTRLGALGDD